MAKANIYNKTMRNLVFIALIMVVGASIFERENYGCGKHGKEGYATKCCGM